jgi:hypothetical protein
MKIPSAIRCVSNHHPPPRRSNRLAGLSSDNVCLSNYKSGEKEIWNAAHEKDSSSSEFGKVPHQDVILEHKTLETPQPDEPHSVNFSNPHPESSPELGVGFEASFNPYRHGTRDPDSKDDYERKKNVRLNLPDSHDKKSWNELDLILSDVLPRMFNSAKIRSTPSSQLATEFDDFLYGFFLDLCGTVESPIAKQKANSGFKHK